MSFKLPAIPYPPAGEGYWGETTSTIDWCEENYYATIYSAEIVNTTTNLLFVLLALLGLTNCWNNGHDRIFMTTYGGYMAVGLGSFCFHSSLKYPWQLVDELSMIYTACFTCYASFSYMKSTKQRAFIGGTLISLATFITLYYHFLQDPVFHQFSFAVLTTVVLTRSMYIMEKNLRPKWRGERQTFYHGKEEVVSAEEQKRRDARDKAILVQMWWMIAYGLGIFLTGFGLWGLDRVYCNSWRAWRRELGLPWGIFLELHGWWHIMTGIGSYFYIMWGAWLRHCLNGRQDEYQLWWPHMVFTVPLVVRNKDYKPQDQASQIAEKANGHANGSAHYANGSAHKMNGSMNGHVNGSANGYMNGSVPTANGSARKRRA